MRIDAADLRRVVAGIMHAAGSPVAEADAVAENLVGANLRGHDSHGVIRTDLYVLCLDQGWMLADEEIEVVTDNGSLVLVDGKFGLGQTVGPQACRLGIDRAGDGGLSVVGLRHAGHLGRIGHYAEMAADAGLVSIHFVNVAGGAMVAPYGGRSRRMGTNPVTIGIPRPDSEPAILDFATSIVAEGKAQVAMAGGPAMPAGSLIDGEGNVTTDPTVLYRFEEGQPPDPRSGPGALRALGEHKGSGLSFMCELLAGALLGSGCAGPGPNPFCNGMLSIYLDPGRSIPTTTWPRASPSTSTGS